MSLVNDRGHGAEAVDYDASNTIHHREVGLKSSAGEVLLCGERTLSRVEWQIFVEAAKVVIDLRLAFAERIECRAEARRPLTGETVSLSCPARASGANDSLLLPAIAEQRRDMAIDSPRVLCIGRVIIRPSVEDRVAEFAAILSEKNRAIAYPRDG